jgi:hypothetical protein
MTRHSRRALPAILVALAILAICVVAAVSIIQELAGRPALIPFSTWERHVRTLRLDGWVIVSAGAVAAALGLILIGCALLPGRPQVLALAAITGGPGDGPSPAAGVSRSGLRTALSATAADVDGVTAARVRVRRRRVTARVRTELTTTATVRDAVGSAVEHLLRQAGLARPPQVRVSVRQVNRRAAA